nr:hypothetical protein [Tanacetum cinerariifolium]
MQRELQEPQEELAVQVTGAAGIGCSRCSTDESIFYGYTLDVQRMSRYEERVRLLVGTPGASMTSINFPGSSSTPIYSSGSSTPPRYSPRASTPQSYYSGTSRNVECSNCKHLLDKITLLEATMNMYMHPEQLRINSAALFHEVYNNMGKLNLEFVIWNVIHMIIVLICLSVGSSSTLIYSSGSSSTPISFSGTSRDVECSNCKHLLDKITVLEETPRKNTFGCDFLWKEEQVCLLVGSPGASTTPIYSPGSSTPPRYSPRASTPQSYSLGTSRNAECSNCKHLLDKITVFEATVDMYMHPEQHTVKSAALFHEVYNNIGKLDLE